MSQGATTVKGIHHIGLSVSDLDRALAFYRSTTTLDSTARRTVTGDARYRGNDHPQTGPVEVAVLNGPNAYLELAQIVPAASADSEPLPVEGPGVTHVCFQSPAPSKLYSRFIDHGATAVSRGDAPIALSGNGVRYGYARDADGIMFEVEQIDEPRFDDPVWIAHVSLVSPDIDRLVAFYENLLGVAPYGRANKLTGPRLDEVTGIDGVRIRAAWFNAGNMVLELWEYVTPATPEPAAPRAFDAAGYNRFVFEVSDVDREVERLSGDGVEFLEPPSELVADSEGHGGREAYARDPDGNLFGLVQFSPGSEMSLDRLKRIHWM